jgi:hypothetical protein
VIQVVNFSECFFCRKALTVWPSFQLTISGMSRVRRLHYEGLIWRFQFLMLATLLTCAMTAIGFILGQVLFPVPPKSFRKKIFIRQLPWAKNHPKT